MFRLFTFLLIVGLGYYAMALSAPVLAAETEHGAEAEGSHAEAGHTASLPMNWRGDLALFSLVTFLVFVFVLGTKVWGPLQQGLDERERGIKQNIADAEASRLKSESLLRDYEIKLAKVQDEVREILAEARRDAEHARQEIAATAQREAEATKQRAIAEIERSRDQALGELFDFVSNNVVSATEQVIGRSLSGADHTRLVDEALAQLNVRRN